MKKIIIYGLYSSKNPNIIRYIGKTTETIKKRLSRHINSSKTEKTRKAKWIRKEIYNKNKILIKNIFEVPEHENWQKWEVYFINFYSNSKENNITNSTIGGEDLQGKNNPFFGKNHTKNSIKQNIKNQPNRKEIDMYDLNGNFIKSYTSISNATLDTQIPMSSISNVCKKNKNFKTAGGYVWRFKNEPFSLDYSNPAEKLQKKICQYDKKGILINEYNSISEAARINKISLGNISRCCNFKIKTTEGYIWRFKGEKFFYIKTRLDAKKIIQLTKTGSYICEYNSISEASKCTGINYSGIYFCCTAKYKHSGGYKWQFN